MNMSTGELAPLGGMLDSLLDRLAFLEKFADSSPPSTSLTTATNDNTNDAALIQSLQSEIADLRTQLEDSEKQRQRLERQLASAGIKVAEDIPYDVAKSKVKSIAERMQEIGSANVEVEGDEEKQKALREEYFVLELKMEKYNNALLTSDEYIEEGTSKERQWERDVSNENQLALMALRRHMPVDIKNYTEVQLASEPSPNGKYLPKVIAKKFRRCDVLQILRMDPKSIARSHPASLENYRINGMALTERRAVYSHLTESKIDEGEMTIAATWAKNRKDAMVDRKFTWYTMMRDNLKSALATYEAHVKQCGPPDKHECNLIGNQCPVRADRNGINYYEEDYGYPEGDVYHEPENAASVSLSTNPEKMVDPTQLSGDRVQEELRNMKRLAYEDWKKAYEREYKIYVETMAVREVKVEELENQIDEFKADETKYSEEHKSLKRELSALPKGSRERLPLMKTVNVTQTQCKEARRRSVTAMEELEKLRSKLNNESEFACSVPKPDCDEVEGSANKNSSLGLRSLSPSSTSSGTNGEPRRHSQMSAMNIFKNNADSTNGSFDSNRRHSTSGTPRQCAGRGGFLAAIQGRGQAGGRGLVSPRGSSKGRLLANIKSKETTNNGVTKKITPSNGNSNLRSTEDAQEIKAQDGQSGKAQDACNDNFVKLSKTSAESALEDTDYADVKNSRANSRTETESSLETAGDTTSEAAQYARKPSNDYVIAAYAPSRESRVSQTYKRKPSSGKGVNKTTLVSCPPPTQEAVKEERLKRAAREQAKTEAAERAERVRKEKEALERKVRRQEETERLKKDEMEKARAEAAERAVRIRKEKEALEQTIFQQEEAERLKKDVIEKARAEAAERAERLRKQKETREFEEACQREEADRKERERQEILTRQREEEMQTRRLARAADEKSLLEEENRAKEEQEHARNHKISELQHRIDQCIEEVAEHEEMMQQQKKELKKIPRGPTTTKDRVAKMKEINQVQSRRGEAKKAAVAAQDELDDYLKSK